MYLYFLTSTHPRRYKIGLGWHLYRRHKQVDKTTKGSQRVLVAFIMPLGARWAETMLHRRYKRHHAPLKYGSGKSEYFRRGFWICEAVAIAGLISAGQWVCVWIPIYIILLIALTCK